MRLRQVLSALRVHQGVHQWAVRRHEHQGHWTRRMLSLVWPLGPRSA